MVSINDSLTYIKAMTIEYIISKSGTFHIPLFNCDNKYCYWLSILHRLHTSNTLNACVLNYFKNNTNNENIESLLLEPVYIYAQFNGEDTSTNYIIRIYGAIRSFMYENIPHIIHENAQNGYQPELLLVHYYCPIIHHLFKSEFVNILNEIHVNKIEFESSFSVVEDAIRKNNQFLKNDEDQLYMLNLYKKMINETMSKLDSVNLEPFVSATIETFPNKDHVGGHALTLIYGISDIDYKNIVSSMNENNTSLMNENIVSLLNGKEMMLYVIDDQRSISPMYLYYTDRNERIYELSIRDITDVTANFINNELHNKSKISKGCKFSKRITRYSLCFEDNFLTPTDEMIKSEFRNKSTNITNILERKNISKISGGGLSTMSMWWLILALLIAVIVIIIIAVVYRQQMNQPTNESTDQ